MRRQIEATGALLLALLLAAAAAAQEPEDWREAVAELADADQPLTARERRELLAAEGTPPAGSWHGLLRAQGRRDIAGRNRPELHLAAGSGAWDLRARWRQAVTGAGSAAWAAGWSLGPARWWAGGFGWRQGFGLLSGSPGRRGSLTADGGLGPARSGVVPWTGWPDPRALTGGGVGVVTGPWQLEAAAGRRQAAAAPGLLFLGAIGRRSGSWRLAATVTGPAQMEASGCGRWRRGSWTGAWEVFGRGGSGRMNGAAVLQVAWRGGRVWRCELVTAASTGQPGTLAPGHALLGADAGAAWAGRLAWRPRTGAHVLMLLGRARREAVALPDPRVRELGELLAGCRVGGDLVLTGRLRRTAGSRRRWDAAQPWAPPTHEPTSGRTTMGAGLGATGHRWRWHLDLRTMAVADAPTAGRRSLVRLAGAGRHGPWRWRVSWRQAWGAPVDLVTAVATLPGRIDARHWGRWAGGWFVALGLVRGPLELHGAADLRRQEADGQVAAEIWAAARARW